MTPKKTQQLLLGGDVLSTLWMSAGRSSRWSAVAMLLVAACGDGSDAMSLSDGAPACPVPAASAPTALTGGWEGTLTLKQTLSGQTGQADVKVVLGFDGSGYPITQIAALGFVGTWSAYTVPGCTNSQDLRRLFVDGDVAEVHAYQYAEANQPGNQILLHTTELSRDGDSLRWSYEASYRAADLLHYVPYAYQSASAPAVQLTATELYAVSGNALSVQASAMGQDEKGQPVSISLTGSLNPAAPIFRKSTLH